MGDVRYVHLNVSIPDRDYRGFRRFFVMVAARRLMFQSLIGIIEDFDQATLPAKPGIDSFNP